MSNEHKRWNPQLEQYYKGVNKTPSYRPKMTLDITGRYVLESDYAALLYRIEELEHRLNQERKAYEKDIYVWQDNYASLEAKLAKAVTALKFYRSAIDLRIDCEITYAMQEAHDYACATLAELKGDE